MTYAHELVEHRRSAQLKLSLRWRRSNCRRAVAFVSNWLVASPLFFSSFLLARLALLFLHLAALCFEKGQAVQLTNLESGTSTNLVKPMRMARRSLAAALSVVSALHSDSTMRMLSRQVSNLA